MTPGNRWHRGGPRRYGPAVDDPDGYFGERVAATYDQPAGISEPGAVEPAAEVLARLAGRGRTLGTGGTPPCQFWPRGR